MGEGGCKIKGKKPPFVEQWSLPRLLPVSEAKGGQRAQELYEKESMSSLSKRSQRSMRRVTWCFLSHERLGESGLTAEPVLPPSAASACFYSSGSFRNKQMPSSR